MTYSMTYFVSEDVSVMWYKDYTQTLELIMAGLVPGIPRIWYYGLRTMVLWMNLCKPQFSYL